MLRAQGARARCPCCGLDTSWDARYTALALERSAPAAAATGSAVSDARAISAETRSTEATAREASAPAPVAAGSAAPDARAISAETRSTDRTVAHATPCATGTASGAVIEQGDGLFLSTAAARRIACNAGRCSCTMRPTAACSTSGAGPARRCGAPWRAAGVAQQPPADGLAYWVVAAYHSPGMHPLRYA
jgi:hypothetical protein